MEFSSQYAMAPAFGSQTKGLMYQFGTFTDANGAELPGGDALQRTALQGQVFARLDRAEPGIRTMMRWSQPNFFLPFDKMGIDPFSERFPIRFVLEGTVRGTGGLKVVDDGCATTVPGLFAAGDVASRELVTGAISGGGSHNGAWAISSGGWAGAAAARFAARRTAESSTAPLIAAGGVGLRPKSGVRLTADEVINVVQQRVLPLRHNRFRTKGGLHESLDLLDPLWSDAREHLGPQDSTARGRLRSRQAAAMLAHARWMYRSALARTETRGLHIRDDQPGTDPAQAHRIGTGGLDHIWTRPEYAGLTVPTEEARAS
jgi:succinate dehydrogenase/fumarate reductase flavoprotein subunit